MSLTDSQLRALRPREKSFRKADARGLYIEIQPTGSKLWRLKYRIGGKEKRLALGAYPTVSLSDARRRCEDAKRLIEQGIDPSLERRKRKALSKLGAQNTFAAIANEYILKMERDGRADSTIRKARWFLSLMAPSIGSIPISDVSPQILLSPLAKLEQRGIHETAKKCRSFASRVFRYAVQTGRASHDPALLLQGALVSPKVRHYSTILDAGELGRLLRAIDNYGGYPSTRLALQIAPHVFLRPGELRQARWSEIDFQERTWEIPAERMKSRRLHKVPLSEQVIDQLEAARELTGGEGYVFPAFHSNRRPLSENSINAAFRRMGFGKDQITAHGLRSTASTFLNESNLWNPDAIERALAHADRDKIRAAYHRGEHWDERVRMAQWWSDFLDDLRNLTQSS